MIKINPKRKESLKVILFLAIIAGFLLGIKILFVNKKEPQPPTFPTPTVFIIPSPEISPPLLRGDENAPLEIRKEISHDYPLFQYIPYKTTNWKIDYSKPLTLEITLSQDTPEIRQEVISWIKNKGVDPLTHQLIWK